MIALVTEWGHALAAFLFAALVLWQATIRQAGMPRLMLMLACGITAIWCGSVAAWGPLALVSDAGKNLVDLGWLAFLFALQPPGRSDRRGPIILSIYAVLVAILMAGIAVRLLPLFFEGSPRIQEGIALSNLTLRVATAIGALVLVHNLFAGAPPEARWGIGLPLLALAVMWIFDLNLASVAYLTGRWPADLFAIRGFVLALLAPMLVTVSRLAELDRVRLSRSATFQTLSLIAIAFYLSVMVMLSKLLQLAGNVGMMGQVTVALGFSSLALLLFPSTRMRSSLKSTLARHLFQHRYDYRLEWLRFTDTLGRAGEGAAPLAERMVKAIADIADSPGGLLLLTADDGGLDVFARLGWSSLVAPQRAADSALSLHLASSGQVIELDPVRRGDPGTIDILPRWMIEEEAAWLIVPLLHFDRLVGAVLLEQPRINHQIDWEDHDLLQVAGRQVASYLAEARGQEALSDARRFDEFNRRFAFIMHDIKNLVSQLSLLARNAERHADNPAFRADMIATLQSSVGKMNDLLARLSQHHRGRAEAPRGHVLRPIVDRIVASRRSSHPVEVHGQDDIAALVDPARLDQALGHLVQNAIDASAPDSPVDVRITRRGDEAVIEVVDRGCGMSAEFVHARLFHAFASTKDGGFGIGAFEARSLIVAMGGRIEVDSREGEGSRFAIILPSPGPIPRTVLQAAQ